MFEILTLNKIAKCGLDQLGENYAITDNEESNPDGIILRSFNMHDMELGSNLKAVARAGAGTNNIPIEKCTEKGIVVFNTPGANANAVKEAVIAGLILSSRDVIGGVEWAKELSGDNVAKQVEKGKSSFAGTEIKGKTLGVIGLGAIGILVANAAYALGMDVIGYDPYLSVDAALKLSRHVKKVNDPKEIFENSDYITIHVPFMESTKDTINAENIAMMKDGVKILNFARNGLVNNDAIKDALASGKVSSYVVDFPNEETINQKGIIAIPHLGASTMESEDNCAVMASREIADYLENGNIENSVNFPACSLPVNGVGRVAILHKNVKNVIAKFTEALSEVNICDMINKSKNDVAYTIINTDHEITPDIIEKLNNNDAVIAVRLIK
ncbi:MAG: 3-phosphoglycerate dehydrogenase family protein [Clostridia bacterium]|nr:3-phosphoglycerate dehydrogenase family protein [Clostridia bacterium]